MKKNLFITTILSITSVLLSSCTLFGTGKDLDKTPAVIDGKYTYEKNAKDVVGQGLSNYYLQSTGTARILVIPVAFKGESFSNVKLQRLYNSFFKDSEYTGWESVYSFYNKSSYGKLNITGTVSDVVNLDITVSQYQSYYNQYDKQGLVYTDMILEKAIDQVAKQSDISLSDYDMDGNGYIDAVWLAYSASYNNSSALWAYTTWDINTDQSISNTSFKGGLYSWASIDFLTEKEYSKNSIFSINDAENGDAHTYIHEVGHMLGLDDYYSYDYGDSSVQRYMYDEPVGGVAMMDFNVGDHDMFSKYMSGWITPTIITDEYLSVNGNTLTLTSSQSSNSNGNRAFLIPRYKNGSVLNSKSVFDEYLLIEYYTPTGLNESDISGYNGAYTYGAKGVLVYHVNASIGKVTAGKNNTLVWDKKTYDEETILSAKNDSKLGVTYAYTYIYSNTKTYCYNQINDTSFDYYRGRLISLLPQSGTKIKGTASGRVCAKSNVLFQKGNTFGSNGVYSDFKFDDNSTPQYGFTVNSLTDTDCSITFQEF